MQKNCQVCNLATSSFRDIGWILASWFSESWILHLESLVDIFDQQFEHQNPCDFHWFVVPSIWMQPKQTRSVLKSGWMQRNIVCTYLCNSVGIDLIDCQRCLVFIILGPRSFSSVFTVHFENNILKKAWNVNASIRLETRMAPVADESTLAASLELKSERSKYL